MKKKNQSNYRAKIVRMQSNFEEVSFQAQNAALVWICKRYAGRRHQAKIPRVKGSFNLEALVTKQLLRAWYGDMPERQFSRLFYKEANRNVENFLSLLESRLDVVIHRSGFVPSIFAARQLINHQGVFVNGKITRSPGYMLKRRDLIEFSKSSFTLLHKNLRNFVNELEPNVEALSANASTLPRKLTPFYMLRHLAIDLRSLRIIYLNNPKASDIPLPFSVSGGPGAKIYYQNRKTVTKGKRGYDSHRFFDRPDLQTNLKAMDIQKLRFYYK